jgi:site-specific DNA-methyltransferase (adenine-specific)
MTPHYEDAGLRLWHGSNKDILPTFEDDSFDSIVTDPPYELGFMGKGWDSSGIAYDVDVWRECLRVLKPGGHLLAFGGSRTWHRMAVAIEDAGFEMRDSIAWLYGSGFPKSMDVSKAIDKLSPRRGMFASFAAHYAERRKASGLTHAQVCEIGKFYAAVNHGGASVNWEKGNNVPTREQWNALAPALGLSDSWLPLIERVEADRAVTGRHLNSLAVGPSGLTSRGEGKERRDNPATDEARTWAGWGTALKPAFEPIVVARKPFRGTIAQNVLTHGTSALNVDACRIEGRERTDYGLSSATRTSVATYGRPSESADFDSSKGRWPTNVLVDQSQAEVLADVARFFPTFRYEAKAPTSERPNVDGTVHATVKPLELMRWLVRLVTRRGGRVLDIYSGSGTTGEAALLEGCEVDLIELEEEHLPLILARVKKPLHPSIFGDWEESA